MKGFWFYLSPWGTVFAAETNRWNKLRLINRGGSVLSDGFGAMFTKPNSVVMRSSVSIGYLKNQCKRLNEKEARTIHPELFKHLDLVNARITKR